MLSNTRPLTGLLLSCWVVLAQGPFPNTCPAVPGRPAAGLPFSSIAESHPIDKTCGTQGKATSPAPSRTQNAVKNNFCATAPGGKAITVTPQILINLQAKTHITTGQGKEPPDRSAATKLGEGDLVRMKAFIIEAHHADLGTGESVNCDGPTEEDNDIHIALGPTATTPECASVTAEISPHFRPTTWNEIGHFQKFDAATNKNVVNAPLAARLQAQPLRFTGQRFFDASHSPCPCGVTCAPVRSSLWEIHPVYAIDVCKVGTTCDVTKDQDWTPFDTWWKNLPPLNATANKK